MEKIVNGGKAMKKYRVVEGIGRYMDLRWEVQEYSNIHDKWYMVYHCHDKQRCEEVAEKYNAMSKKERIPFDADLWN